MHMLIVFLFCLLFVEANAAETLLNSPMTTTPKSADTQDGWVFIPPPVTNIQKLFDSVKPNSPKVNTLMETAVQHYSDAAKFWQPSRDPSWDVVFLESLWKLSTIQGHRVTVAPFKPSSPQQAGQEREAIRQSNLTFAFLVGVMQASCWQDASLSDVAAFIEKASGFEEKELQAITPESFFAKQAYQHNVHMILARLMGYQMTRGASASKSLTELETLYSQTIIAQIITCFRRDEIVNLEASFTEISAKFSPLYPSFSTFFQKQRKNFSAQPLKEIIWKSQGTQLYSSLLSLSESCPLWTLALPALSSAFTQRETEVNKHEDEC